MAYLVVLLLSMVSSTWGQLYIKARYNLPEGGFRLDTGTVQGNVGGSLKAKLMG